MHSHPWSKRTLVAISCLGATAAAAPQLDWQPRAWLSAGYDDNVLLDNAGGDAIGRLGAGLRLMGRERGWRTSGELRLEGLGFADRQRAVLLGEALWELESRPWRTTRVGSRLRLRVADDPLALAQLGLLAGQGRTAGYRSVLWFEQALGGLDPGAGDAPIEDAPPADDDLALPPLRRLRLDGSLRLDGVAFVDRSDGSDGQVLTLDIGPSYAMTRALRLSAALEGRTWLQRGVLAQSVGILPGVRWRLWRRTFVEASGGPLAWGDAAGWLAWPVLRARLMTAWRGAAAEWTVHRDLTVPAGRGGVLAGETMELLGHWGVDDWELRGRAGGYLTSPSPRDDRDPPAYGLEAGVFRRLADALWLGLTALRYERQAGNGQPALVRDAIYLRLDWGEVRP